MMLTPRRALRYRNEEIEQIGQPERGVHTFEEPRVGYKGLSSLALKDHQRIAKVIIPAGARVVVPNKYSGKYRTDEFYVASIETIDGDTRFHGYSPMRSLNGGNIYVRWCTYSTFLDERTGTECSKGLHFCPTMEHALGWARQ